VLHKPALAHHYEVFGSAAPATLMIFVGCFELVLGALVLAVRAPVLIYTVCIWKLASECLFLTSGAPAPVFEVIERGGSYIVPLALAYLLARPAESAPLPTPQLSGSI